MSKALLVSGYQQSLKLLIIQLVLLLIVASFGLIKEFKIALALLSGGVAVFIGNVYFTFKAFSHAGAQQTKKVVGAFYLGETVKILLSVGLLVTGFIVLPSYELYVLIGYITALLGQWLTPIIVKTH